MALMKIDTDYGRFYVFPREGETYARTARRVQQKADESRRSIYEMMKAGEISPSITNLSDKSSSVGEAVIKPDKFLVPDNLKHLTGFCTGLQVHGNIEEYFNAGSLPKWDINPLTSLYLESFKEFIQDYNVTPLLVEAQVTGYLDNFKYAGTLDLLANVDGKKVLIDWKSGGGVSVMKTFAQIWASYNSTNYFCTKINAIRPRASKNTVEEGWVVHLTPGQGYRVYKDIYSDEVNEDRKTRLVDASKKLIKKLKQV